MAQRFLLIRLSSMGDIVLTTPLLRALRQSYPQAEIHYLTRPAYAPLLQHNPHLTALHLWPPTPEILRSYWDGVIDLQKNLRTWRLRLRLRYKRWTTFPKKNLRKWLSVRLKKPLPVEHIVKRYGKALKPWGIEPHQLGPLEVYVPSALQERIQAELHNLHPGPWLAWGLGGTYVTKKWPTLYKLYLINRLGWPVVLLGGETEAEEAAFLAEKAEVPVLVGAGRYSLLETAAAIAEAALVLSHDTGTAHLAAAFQKPTIVLWGNTTPAFGMTPWLTPHRNLEVPDLPCRPCSKLGFAQCPKGHHNCMRALTPDFVLQEIHTFWAQLHTHPSHKA